MTKQNLLQPEKIHFIDFGIVKGQIESDYDFEIEKILRYDFNSDFKVSFKQDEKLAKADFKVSVSTKSEQGQSKEASGFFHFVFLFMIENFDELAHKNEETGRFKYNPALGNALASITYSTSRGILMTRFQGTALSEFILPIINPNDLLKKQPPQS